MDSSAAASDKKAQLDTIIAGTTSAACAVNVTLLNSGNANCYGPTLNYTNHPTDNSSGSLPGGDLGIWEASTGGEACASAQLNSRIQGISSIVDSGLFTMTGMICSANVTYGTHRGGLIFPRII